MAIAKHLLFLILLLWAGVAEAQSLPTTQCVSTAVAGGTGDAITIPQLPCTATSTLLVLSLTGTNLTTSPTIQQIGVSSAQTVLNANGSAVGVSALQSGTKVILTYNGVNWFLLTNFVPSFNVTNPGVFTNTQMNEYATSLLNGLSPSTEYSGSFAGNFSTDALAGGVAVPVSATVYQSNAVAGYATNLSTTTNTVALFGLMKAKAASTKNWSGNTVCEDRGFAATWCVGWEFDININNAATLANGITLLGASLAQPTTGNAITVGGLGTGIHWPTGGVFVGDAAAPNAYVVGKTAASGTNIGSQAVLWDYTNGSSTALGYNMSVDTTQTLTLVSSAGGSTASFLVDGTVNINAGAASFAILNFASARATKYQLFRDTSGNFAMQDNTNSLSFLTVTTAGNTTLGETGKTLNLVSAILQSNGTAAVSCTAGTVNVTTEVVTNGIVTHC